MYQYASYDKALENLKSIQIEFKSFCSSKGSVSESDTRVKLIDRILKEVLFWSDNNIEREKYIKGERNGYVDYLYELNGDRYIVIEAKRQGNSFQLAKKIKTVKISSLLESQNELSKAIQQTKDYCDSVGSQFGITTNGYSWIIFESYPKNKSWEEGKTIVFNSLEEIINNFCKFWELLSVDYIRDNSLSTAFLSSIYEEREYLFDRLAYDFDNKNHLYPERIIKVGKQYIGKELPLAKANLESSGYSDKEKRYYFNGELYTWLRPLYEYKDIIRLNYNSLFIEVDREEAANIFEDRKNYEIQAIMRIEEEYIYFDSFKLCHILEKKSYIINGITNPYPIKILKLCDVPIKGITVNSQTKELHIIDRDGKYIIFDYIIGTIKKELQVVLNKEHKIYKGLISEDGKHIIIFTEDGKYLYGPFFQIVDSIIDNFELEENFDETKDMLFCDNENIVIVFKNSFEFINLKTLKYESVEAKKNKIAQIFNSEKFSEVYVNNKENILAVKSEKSLYIIDTKNRSILYKIKSYDLNLRKTDKIVYAGRECAVLKLKGDNHLLEIYYDNGINIKKSEIYLSDMEKLIKSERIGSSRFLATAYKAYDREAYGLKIASFICNDKCTYLKNGEDDIISIISSEKDGILFSTHSNGSIKIWQINKV